jgi:hypothetical protein
MSIFPQFTHLRLVFAAALLGLVGCQALPTLESIKYGYSPSRADVQPAPPKLDDYNDVAAGWAPERQLADQTQSPTGLYGRDGRPVGVQSRDGSPVVASAPGAVTQTPHPMNDGVVSEAAVGGSRGTMLDKYLAVVDELEILRPENEDLHLALEMSELRANDFSEQLKSMQIAYDELGKSKQAADSQTYELAARLATAQIARLEAERALLEATLEWRKMSVENNRPLGGDSGQSGMSGR